MAATTLALKYAEAAFGGFNGVLVDEKGSGIAWVAAPNLQSLQEAAQRCAPAGSEVRCVPDPNSLT